MVFNANDCNPATAVANIPKEISQENRDSEEIRDSEENRDSEESKAVDGERVGRTDDHAFTVCRRESSAFPSVRALPLDSGSAVLTGYTLR